MKRLDCEPESFRRHGQTSSEFGYMLTPAGRYSCYGERSCDIDTIFQTSFFLLWTAVNFLFGLLRHGS